MPLLSLHPLIFLRLMLLLIPPPQAILSHPLYSVLHSVYLSPPQDTRSYWQSALLSAAASGDEDVCRLLTSRKYWQVSGPGLVKDEMSDTCQALAMQVADQCLSPWAYKVSSWLHAVSSGKSDSDAYG